VGFENKNAKTILCNRLCIKEIQNYIRIQKRLHKKKKKSYLVRISILYYLESLAHALLTTRTTALGHELNGSRRLRR
jgi:hypothetical protein